MVGLAVTINNLYLVSFEKEGQNNIAASVEWCKILVLYITRSLQREVSMQIKPQRKN